MIKELQTAIIKASKDLGSNKIVYEINFWSGVSQSLKISRKLPLISFTQM
jgi:hypothetical protein